jgi:hypothetical protein
MSLDGSLDDVVESFYAVAKASSSAAIRAAWASSRAVRGHKRA